MNNNYFQFLELWQLQKKYQSIFDKIEENDGELNEEDEILLQETESDYLVLLNDIINLSDQLNDTKISREREIKRLTAKNTAVDNSVSYLRKFIQSIVKQKGVISKSGNTQLKFNDYSLTIGNRESAEISEEFDNKDYTTYQLKSKIPIEHAERIKNYLSQRELPVELEKSIDKRQVLNDLKEGKVIENAELKSTPYLIKK